MKAIGYWMGNLHQWDLPLPQELVGNMEASLREEICRYLESGHLFAQYRGCSWCRFQCGVADEAMGSGEFTDGTWVWPEGLVHYVRHHRVVVPEEFVASVKAGGIKPEPTEWGSPSLDFWREWSGQRQSPEVRQRLREALEIARVEEPKRIERWVEEIRAKEGEGVAICQWAGCGMPVLAGRGICARHFLEPEMKSRMMDLYRLPDLSGV
ncbi:hypothetical protein [Luteolibacter sp. LG18]|uniref:hypothetical protein n=1 Tax=Luteolibacter sp. LG18 TaxID=2819286 RepID=UPI002B290850|nr:hypothetical protein llg_30150 [Luteolibacter sp. LG18]